MEAKVTTHRPEIKPQGCGSAVTGGFLDHHRTAEPSETRSRRLKIPHGSFFPLQHLKDKRTTTLPAAYDSRANNRLHCNAITVIYAALPVGGLGCYDRWGRARRPHSYWGIKAKVTTLSLQSNNLHVRSNLKVLKVDSIMRTCLCVCVCAHVCVRVCAHVCLTPICMDLVMSRACQ